MEDGTNPELRSLNHGLFQLTLPNSGKQMIAWFIGIVCFLVTALLFFISLTVPDIAPTEEAYRMHPDEVTSNEIQLLGKGFESDEKGTYLLLSGEIQDGIIATGYCSQDDEGNWQSNTNAYEHGSIMILPFNGSSFNITWYRELSPEFNAFERDCPTDDWEISQGDVVNIFLLKQEDDLWLLSAAEQGLQAPEKTGREDMQRFALLTTAIGSVLMMVTTPSSLSSDLKKIRKLSGDMIHLHGLPGALEPSKGPVRSNDESSWILPVPNYTNWSENPYAADEGSELIDEHPIKVGTPSPATFTLYSINGIIFITATTWLASDLLARHGSGFHWFAGNVMRLGLVVFTIIWSYLAFKRWKLVHNIIDTPTSKVRSVAVGAAELVGQVRPGPEGTLSFNVGGDVSRLVEGAVAYKWVEEEHVCRGSGEDRTCSWETRRKENASVPFILHDGTGGILVDPSSWEKVDYGSMLHRWGTGDWRWTVHVFGAGDPVYCLGRVETRKDDEKEEGHDGSIPNAQLIVRGNKDVGMETKLNRGTEFSLLSSLRSTTEAIIVPLLMLVSSIIPFFW